MTDPLLFTEKVYDEPLPIQGSICEGSQPSFTKSL